MARVSRSRQRMMEFPSGYVAGRFSAGSAPFLVDNSSTTIRRMEMVDSVGRPVTDSSMQSYKLQDWSVEGVSGVRPNGTSDQYATAENYFPPRMRGDLFAPSSTGWPINPTATTRQTWVNQILARSNPNRPDYSVGSIVQGFWELPRILKGIGDLLRSGRSPIGARGIANHTLAAKFGWIPLFNDISTMLDVDTYVARRNAELNRLFSNTGLRRRINLMELSNSSSSNQVVDSGFPLYMSGHHTVTNKSRVWGTVRWKPASSFPFGQLSDIERLALAKRLVIGATASGAFVSSWDLIPWTWLLGWVTDIKSYVLAHGNTVPVKPTGGICLMAENTQTKSLGRITLAEGFSGGSGNATWVHKRRWIYAGASPTTYAPYLSTERLSILTLLAAQRLR